MRRLLVGLLTLAVLAASCSKEREAPGDQHRVIQEKNEAEVKKGQAPIRPHLYDRKGRLLPSEDFMVGIQLPRGLTLLYERNLVHMYKTEVPIEKVLAYFGPLMITGKVDQVGKGAIYRNASVQGAEMNPTKVEVSILEAGNAAHVSIRELPPPPIHTPSNEETRRKAADAWERLD